MFGKVDLYREAVNTFPPDLFVSEVEVRRSVPLIVSEMETSYITHNIVQCCSLIEIFRTVTAFVRQNALRIPRVSLVSLV